MEGVFDGSLVIGCESITPKIWKTISRERIKCVGTGPGLISAGHVFLAIIIIFHEWMFILISV